MTTRRIIAAIAAVARKVGRNDLAEKFETTGTTAYSTTGAIAATTSRSAGIAGAV